MKNKEKVKKVCKNIISVTLITVAPSLFSPLHLAAYSDCKKKRKRKRG